MLAGGWLTVFACLPLNAWQLGGLLVAAYVFGFVMACAAMRADIDRVERGE